jgi:hypothetical protein
MNSSKIPKKMDDDDKAKQQLEKDIFGDSDESDDEDLKNAGDLAQMFNDDDDGILWHLKNSFSKVHVGSDSLLGC